MNSTSPETEQSFPAPPPQSEEELINRAHALAGLSFAQLAELSRQQIPEQPQLAKGWGGQLLEGFLETMKPVEMVDEDRGFFQTIQGVWDEHWKKSNEFYDRRFAKWREFKELRKKDASIDKDMVRIKKHYAKEAHSKKKKELEKILDCVNVMFGKEDPDFNDRKHKHCKALLFDNEKVGRLARKIRNCSDQMEELKKDKLMREVLGEHLFERYLDVKKREWDEFKKEVTSWEIDTYLDIF